MKCLYKIEVLAYFSTYSLACFLQNRKKYCIWDSLQAITFHSIIIQMKIWNQAEIIKLNNSGKQLTSLSRMRTHARTQIRQHNDIKSVRTSSIFERFLAPLSALELEIHTDICRSVCTLERRGTHHTCCIRNLDGWAQQQNPVMRCSRARKNTNNHNNNNTAKAKNSTQVAIIMSWWKWVCTRKIA